MGDLHAGHSRSPTGYAVPQEGQAAGVASVPDTTVVAILLSPLLIESDFGPKLSILVVNKSYNKMLTTKMDNWSFLRFSYY